MKKIWSVILICALLCSSFAMMASGAVETESVGSSASAPAGYSPVVDDDSTKDVKAAAQQEYEDDDPRVILIQDVLPWDSNANETVLRNLGVSYIKVSTSDLDSLDLWEYDMVIMANDQPLQTYQNYKTFKENLDLFANLGGVIVYGACDEGWADGTIQVDLPGNVKKHHEYSFYDYIADDSHPIVTGILTDGQVLTDNDLHEHYCSHSTFDESTLPQGSKVILRSSQSDEPTLVQYPFGSGYVIASGLTWEFNYVRNNYGVSFAQIAMDDMFVYALSLCGGFVENTEKMAIKRDNNNFSHSSSSFFNTGEDEQYWIDDVYFDKLNSFYEESFWEWLPLTENQLQKERVSKWGGSCFGLSVSMALVYMKQVALSNFVPGKDAYYKADTLPRNNAAFRSLINYYQLSQYLPLVDKKEANAYLSDAEEFTKELKTVVNLARQSDKSGIPFILTLGWSYLGRNEETGAEERKSAGHAIVCIGVSETKNGYRLKFIDPNNQSDYLYAMVSKDYSSISFESKYNAAGKKGFILRRIGHDTLSIFSPIDIDGSNNAGVRAAQEGKVMAAADRNVDLILFNSDASFTLTGNDGKTLVFNGDELSGTMEILDIQFYEKGESVDYQVAVASRDSYEISSSRNYLDISINNVDHYFAFSGKGAESVSIDMDSSLSAEGKKMDCDLFIGVNGENTDMICVENEKTNNLALTLMDSQVKVEGDNLNGCEVTAFYDSSIYDLDADRKGDTLFVNQDNTIPFVCKLSEKSLRMNYKATATLAAKVTSSNEYTRTWESTNTNVVTVDNQGNLTATGTGTAEVICKVTDSEGNTTTSSCEVKVKYTFLQWLIVIFLFGWLWY